LLILSCHCAPITLVVYFLFVLHDTASSEIYTLSLHDALPICAGIENTISLARRLGIHSPIEADPSISLGSSSISMMEMAAAYAADRKSTRLNSSHVKISYAVFCLKKKKPKTGISATN